MSFNLKKTVKNTLIFLILIPLACSQKSTNYYQGLVLDENDIPLENVQVFEVYGKENGAKTDEKGYFRLQRNSELLTSLVFQKEGFKTDTVPVFWTQHGEKVHYQFTTKDTTVVRLMPRKPF
ncbi:carboxypeptidase-like regulatory domain-containing protein [Algoriphagus litoralis]|uniref:carboxypeptidase-like regulatory domain-containing protein n=1 Tax=Algoriphagus litoralis TaxID=2202829 RepID=UPI000DB9D802|nr:carboxypeptidase-like regulatory domain-containing protein [Algoriphagus litoralis]